MTITSEDMKLLEISELIEKLKGTEPLGQVPFGADTETMFNLPGGWNHELKDAAGTDLTEATVSVNGEFYQLTKDAALQATTEIGLTRAYALRTPGNLVQSHLNYWMGDQTKHLKLLTKENVVQAITKASVIPISNLALLDETLKGIYDEYGEDTLVQADYKLNHDLRRTNYRLIVPEQSRTIKSARSDESDTWSLGIDVQNSLTADVATTLTGYLFAWWCTNGATSTHATSGNYSRKGSPTEEQALDWARASVDGILGGLEHELDNVAALTEIDLEGELEKAAFDLFERYKVPGPARAGILAELIETDDVSMYGMMAAITQAANDGGMSPDVVRRLLAIGGDLPSTASGRCSSCHRLPIS